MVEKKAEKEQHEPTPEAKQKSLFVVSPIGKLGSDVRKHADLVFHALIEPVAIETGYDPVRADHVDKPGMITDHIISEVVDSDLCIVDLSFLNPNVFYELGIRHYAGKATIHVAADGTSLPFDNMGARTVFFDLTDWQSQVAARSSIRSAIDEIGHPVFQPTNPVTHAIALREVERSKNPADQVIADLEARLERIERKDRRVGNLRPLPLTGRRMISIPRTALSAGQANILNEIIENTKTNAIDASGLYDSLIGLGLDKYADLFPEVFRSEEGVRLIDAGEDFYILPRS